MKTKSMQFKADTLGDDGTFSGYCNVFDIKDSYGDVVKKGAFINSLDSWQAKNKMPPILWQHDRGQVIGVWTKLYEDDKGLYGEGKLFIDDIAKAKEAHFLIKHGAIDGLSIGYHTKKWHYDNDNKVLELRELDLKEISVVTFPANGDSQIDKVKVDNDTLKAISILDKVLGGL